MKGAQHLARMKRQKTPTEDKKIQSTGWQIWPVLLPHPKIKKKVLYAWEVHVLQGTPDSDADTGSDAHFNKAATSTYVIAAQRKTKHGTVDYTYYYIWTEKLVDRMAGDPDS